MEILNTTISLEINGKTYKFAKTNLGDLADFSVWAKNKRKQDTIQTAKEAGVALNMTDIKALARPLSMAEVTSALDTPEGVCWILARSLTKGNGKEYSPQEAGELLTGINLDGILSQVMDAGNQSGAVGGEPSGN